MKYATGEYRLQLEYAKSLLTTAQERYQTAVDEARALDDAARAEERRAAKAADAAQKEEAAAKEAVAKAGTKKERKAAQKRLDVASVKSGEASQVANLTAMNKAMSEFNTKAKVGKDEYDKLVKGIQKGALAVGAIDDAEAEHLNTLLTEYTQASTALEEIQQKKERGEATDEQVEAAVQRQINAQRELDAALDPIVEDTAAMAQNIEGAAADAGKMTQDIQKNMRDKQRAKELQEDATNKTKKPEGGLSTAQKAGALASGVAQIATAATTATMALKNMFSVFNDDSATTSEKVGAIAMGLMSLIPVFSAMTGGIAMIGQAFGVAGAEAGVAGIIAQAGWWPLIAILLAILAVIGLVIAAVKIFTMEANKTPENKLKRAEEAYENLANAAEEAADAAESLRDQISRYDDAVAKLNDCTQGTQEWRDALDEVNAAIKDIISNNDLTSEQIDILRNGTQDQIQALLKELQSAADATALQAEAAA